MGAYTNARPFADRLDRAGSTIQQRLNKSTRHNAMLLETRIKANASGRPGPNVITGNYRRSWRTTHSGNSSTVHTSAPQARRLEYGFVGPDSLGRVYNQPPFPHVGPAIDTTRPLYYRDLAQVGTDI